MNAENLKIKVPRLGRNRYGVFFVRASALDPAGRRKVRQQSLRTKNPQLARILALEFCLSIADRDSMSGFNPHLIGRYEVDLSTGVVKADGPEDHARAMEAFRAMSAAREAAREDEKRQARIANAHPDSRALLAHIEAIYAEFDTAKARASGPSSAALQPTPSTKAISLKAAFDMHLAEERRHVKPGTHHEKEVLFNDFMACFGAETDLNAITNVLVTTQWRAVELDRPNQKREGEKVGLARLEKRRGFLSKFFKWAINGGLYSGVNPAAAPMATKGEIKRARRSHAEFHSDDLKTLFAPDYLVRMVKPDWYWPPLMALLSGARQSELTDLKLDAFEEREGIKVFEILEGKTGESKRVVPLHDQLLELGIWEYVQALRNRNARLLFPHRIVDKSAKSVGRLWGEWVKECGLGGKQKNFHSFRSIAITDLHNVNAGHAQIRKAVRHAAVGVSGSHGTYVRGIELIKLREAINKLAFPSVDFEKLKRLDPTFSAFFAAEEVRLQARAAKAQSQARHEAAAQARAERNARTRKGRNSAQGELLPRAPEAGDMPG